MQPIPRFPLAVVLSSGLLSGLPRSPQEEAAAYEPPVMEASDEALETLATFEVAEGLEVDLFAAEPMVANPVCLYVSNAGEVYVAETFRHHAGVTDIREHMDWLDDDLAAKSVEERAAYFEKHEGDEYSTYAEEHERIRLIRDTDGDGKADEAFVFADGFNDPMAGIGAGLLEHEGDLYYTCIPDLWRLKDTDGDGQADERERLSTGYGVNVALLGHDLHGLRIGPDGKLYFSSGDRGFRVETESGVLEHHHTGAVLRCDLDGKNLEVFATGLRNPQELVFDEFGNLWTGDNNSDGGDQARWVYVVEGMDAGWRYGWQWITEPNLRGPWNDEQLWHPYHEGQAAYIVPPVANLGNGPSGLTYYPGTGLGDAYAGHFFLCDFRGDPRYSGIHTFTVEPRGAGFELGPVDWLVKNTLVTDADFGPDGRLYFTDWVQGWNKTGKGRVYRAFDPAQVDGELVAVTRKILADGVGERELGELEAMLGHPDQRVRQLAQFELVTRAAGDPLVEELLTRVAFSQEAGQLPRLHAIWGLDMLHRRQPPTPVVSAALQPFLLLADPDVEVRAQMVRALGDSLALTDELIACLEDESPRVQSLAAIALGKRGEAAALPGLWRVLEASAGDPVLRHAAIFGIAGSAKVHEVAEARTHASRQVRLGAVVALRRQHRQGAYVAEKLLEFLLDEDPLVVLEAARAIYDDDISRCYPELAALSAEETLAYPLWRRVMNAHLRLGERWDASALADIAMRSDLDDEIRIEALHLLSIWNAPPGRDYVTGEWRPIEPREADYVPWLITQLVDPMSLEAPGDGASVTAQTLDKAPTAVLKKWIEVAMAVAPQENAARLAGWALDQARPVTIRAACLRELRGTDDAAVVARLREAYQDTDADVRAAALGALRRVAPEEVFPLFERALERGSAPERRTAYRGLADLDDERVEELLKREVTKLEADLIPAELALDLVLAAEARESEDLNLRLELRKSPRSIDEELAPWLDSLSGGDAARGEKLFRENAALSCLRCHAIEPPEPDATVGQVGPALMGVGSRLTRLDLATAVILPNRQIAVGYETESFFFLDGGHLAGRVLSETPEEITVLDAEGELYSFHPDELEVRREALSAMPANHAEALSREDLRDLVEFLSTL